MCSTYGKEAPKPSCRRKLEATCGKETPKSSCKGKVEAMTMPKKKAKIDVTDDGKYMLFLEHDNVTDDASHGNLSDNKSVDNVLASDNSYDNESLPSSNDDYILDSSGIDSDLEEFIISIVKLQCTCSSDKPSHHRSCPLNPRNKGKSAEDSDVELTKSKDAKSFIIGKTPSKNWMVSAALLMQDYISEGSVSHINGVWPSFLKLQLVCSNN